MSLYELRREIEIQGEYAVIYWDDERERNVTLAAGCDMWVCDIPDDVAESSEVIYMYCMDGRLVIEVDYQKED